MTFEIEPCLLCGEDVTFHDEQAQGHWFGEDGRQHPVHRECALRNVLGGIGHLTDHYHWCVKNSDPDMGIGYRQSAIEVDAWVKAHGVMAATDPNYPQSWEESRVCEHGNRYWFGHECGLCMEEEG